MSLSPPFDLGQALSPAVVQCGSNICSTLRSWTTSAWKHLKRADRSLLERVLPCRWVQGLVLLAGVLLLTILIIHLTDPSSSSDSVESEVPYISTLAAAGKAYVVTQPFVCVIAIFFIQMVRARFWMINQVCDDHTRIREHLVAAENDQGPEDTFVEVNESEEEEEAEEQQQQEEYIQQEQEPEHTHTYVEPIHTHHNEVYLHNPSISSYNGSSGPSESSSPPNNAPASHSSPQAVPSTHSPSISTDSSVNHQAATVEASVPSEPGLSLSAPVNPISDGNSLLIPPSASVATSPPVSSPQDTSSAPFSAVDEHSPVQREGCNSITPGAVYEREEGLSCVFLPPPKSAINNDPSLHITSPGLSTPHQQEGRGSLSQESPAIRQEGHPVGSSPAPIIMPAAVNAQQTDAPIVADPDLNPLKLRRGKTAAEIMNIDVDFINAPYVPSSSYSVSSIDPVLTITSASAPMPLSLDHEEQPGAVQPSAEQADPNDTPSAEEESKESNDDDEKKVSDDNAEEKESTNESPHVHSDHHPAPIITKSSSSIEISTLTSPPSQRQTSLRRTQTGAAIRKQLIVSLSRAVGRVPSANSRLRVVPHPQNDEDTEMINLNHFPPASHNDRTGVVESLALNQQSGVSLYGNPFNSDGIGPLMSPPPATAEIIARTHHFFSTPPPTALPSSAPLPTSSPLYVATVSAPPSAGTQPVHPQQSADIIAPSSIPLGHPHHTHTHQHTQLIAAQQVLAGTLAAAAATSTSTTAPSDFNAFSTLLTARIAQLRRISNWEFFFGILSALLLPCVFGFSLEHYKMAHYIFTLLLFISLCVWAFCLYKNSANAFKQGVAIFPMMRGDDHTSYLDTLAQDENVGRLWGLNPRFTDNASSWSFFASIHATAAHFQWQNIACDLSRGIAMYVFFAFLIAVGAPSRASDTAAAVSEYVSIVGNLPLLQHVFCTLRDPLRLPHHFNM